MSPQETPTRVPCKQCGEAVPPAAARINGGLCNSCKNKKLQGERNADAVSDSFTISYTVRPGWGRPSKVYQLSYLSHKIGPVIRFQNGGALPAEKRKEDTGFNHIFEEHQYLENRIDMAKYHEIASHLKDLSLPLVADLTSGWDGTDYGLKVRTGRTEVEYRWYHDIPKQWKKKLKPVIIELVALSPEHDF